mgnify:CR=1 FL=1
MLSAQNWLNIVRVPIKPDPVVPLTKQIAAYLSDKNWVTTDALTAHFKGYSRMQILNALHTLKASTTIEVRTVSKRESKANSFREYRIATQELLPGWVRRSLDYQTATAWDSWINHA